MMGKDTIYFDTDKYNIDSADQAALQAQAAWMGRYPAKRIAAISCCCSRVARFAVGANSPPPNSPHVPSVICKPPRGAPELVVCPPELLSCQLPDDSACATRSHKLPPGAKAALPGPCEPAVGPPKPLPGMLTTNTGVVFERGLDLFERACDLEMFGIDGILDDHGDLVPPSAGRHRRPQRPRQKAKTGG